MNMKAVLKILEAKRTVNNDWFNRCKNKQEVRLLLLPWSCERGTNDTRSVRNTIRRSTRKEVNHLLYPMCLSVYLLFEVQLF